MIESWHSRFNPERFLSCIDIDSLIEQNEAHNARKVEAKGKPCIICRGSHGLGLLLNDNSYLCKTCFAEVSTIAYPEQYEVQRREYLKAREARRQALRSFVDSCLYLKVSYFFRFIGFISFFVLFIDIALIPIPIAICLIYLAIHKIHERKVVKWQSLYPEPKEPLLRHFHDPKVQLSVRDKAILKVFNNWPGYPPFWSYLRKVVMDRDGNRCQVSGCPSRVELHVHHKTPVSLGGEHVPTNLIALCGFYHALEPDEGHARIWGEINTQYFTMVRAHRRRNPVSPGYHDVRAHVRRLFLVSESELTEIIDFYGLSCPSCKSMNVSSKITEKNRQVTVKCLACSKSWRGPRKLTEETGPRLAELLTVTRHKGEWAPRWDMLEKRADSTFRLLKKRKTKSKRKSRAIF